MTNSSQIPNVYISGPPIKVDQTLPRRMPLVREMARLISSSPSQPLLIYGEAKIGKTSLLHQVATWSRDNQADLLPLVINLQGVSMAVTLRGAAEFIANQIQDEAAEAHNLTLPAIDRGELQVDPFPALERWLTQVEAKISNKRLLLCLDDFEWLDHVIAETNSRAPLNFLRYIIQNHRQVALIFSTRTQPSQVKPYWNDCLISAQSIKLGKFNFADTQSLITIPNGHPSYLYRGIYHPEAVSAIFQLTQGHPYFIQLVCSELINLLNTQKDLGKQQITPDDLQVTIPEAVRRGDEVLRGYLRGLSPDARDSLNVIVCAPHKPIGADPFLAELFKQRILEPQNSKPQPETHGDLKFKLPLLYHYVRSAAIDKQFNRS